MDGGIRSGQDVLKAWALGARGTYIGRAFLYGLGAMGEAGVTKALEIIHKELDLTMAFCGRTRQWGARSPPAPIVDRSILLPGTFRWRVSWRPASSARWPSSGTSRSPAVPWLLRHATAGRPAAGCCRCSGSASTCACCRPAC
jgi:hypothetical protein